MGLGNMIFESDHTAEIFRKYESPDYVLDIDPMPTPRPRAAVMGKGENAKVRMYSPDKYTSYKKALMYLIRGLKPRIKRDSYRSIVVVFYIPYPKSTPKKRLIEGMPHQKKPDWDNYIKGLQDAISDVGLVSDDGILSEGFVAKRYTVSSRGRIEFSLIK